MAQPIIPFSDFGGAGAYLHFLHANGYPPACYKPLFEYLKSHFHIVGMHLRPLWPDSKPEELRDWHPLTDDLLRFLAERETDPILGVGHSIGGIVTLRAALKEPHRFRALVLIDPVLFPPYFIAFWNIIRASGLGYRSHPMVTGALKRRRRFDDLEIVFRAYRRRGIFRKLSDENMRAFINGITRPHKQGGYELVYPPEWEAQIYYTGIWHDFDLWRELKNLKVPTLILQGAETYTPLKKTAKFVKKKNPRIQIVTLERATHLLPLEVPEKVGRLIVEYAGRVISS